MSSSASQSGEGSSGAAAPSTASQELLDEVFARVGRNLLICQQAELYLKALLANCCIEATSSGFTPDFVKRGAQVQRQTLGQLAAGVLESFLSDAGGVAADEVNPEVLVPTFRTVFRIKLTNGEDLALWAIKLSAFVDDRNKLVHHFLQRFKLNDDESAQSAIDYLLAQRERISPIRDQFRAWLEAMGEAQKALATHLMTPGTVDLLVLQSSPIVSHLATAAQTLKRADGWTLLSTAANFLVREAPEELDHMRSKYGHATLKRLVLASELFEVRDEALRFGVRALYRVRPELLEPAGA